MGIVRTVITADVYGTGEADLAAGARPCEGLDRDSYCLTGMIGHDFYAGERRGAKGFPRFTDPELRGEDDYADYLRMATERSLERCGADHFDLLISTTRTPSATRSPAVWEGHGADPSGTGLTRLGGCRPGAGEPAASRST